MTFTQEITELLAAQQEAMAEWRYLNAQYRDDNMAGGSMAGGNMAGNDMNSAETERILAARNVALALTRQAYAKLEAKATIPAPSLIALAHTQTKKHLTIGMESRQYLV